MEYLTLNNGVKMPAAGFGVFRIDDADECEAVVLEAIRAGYRYIDTAIAYGNEEAVGRVIAKCGVPRSELFIATKLWFSDAGYEPAKKAFAKSLEKLGLDYVDLYLIHQPYSDYYGSWRAMEELYAAGKIRAIGVDNFTQERLADFITFNKIMPTINYLEVNLYHQRISDAAYMSSKNIPIAVWSPLAAGQEGMLNNKFLLNIADKYGKTPAQIILRWLYQRGIASIVKSANPQRMRQNIDIFNFTLREDDMLMLSVLDKKHSCFPTRETGKDVENFLAAAKYLAVK